MKEGGLKPHETVDISDIWNLFNCGQTMNAAPSLAIYNGNLYVVYKTGGNANKFTIATLSSIGQIGASLNRIVGLTKDIG